MGFQPLWRRRWFPPEPAASRLPGDSLPEAALNPVRTDLLELMLSSTGRISRNAFLGCGAVLAALGYAYSSEVAPRVDPRLGWIVYPLLLFPTACILSKRLHDRSRAGWWAFVPVWALVVMWPKPSTPLGWAGMAVLAVTLVELGLMPSKPETNRFGPPPVERPPED